METKIKNLTEQLDSQANLHQAAIKRAKEAQDDFVDQRARLKQVETSLATDGVLLDNLRSERQKVRLRARW